MKRITEKDLAGMVGRLNRITGNPETYWTDGTINIGHFHLDRAYGLQQLVQTVTEGGGIRTVTGGYATKRECYDRIYAYLRGIEDQQEREAA